SRTRGAEGSADRQVTPARRGTAQQESGDVRARDQQDQRDRAKEDAEGSPGILPHHRLDRRESKVRGGVSVKGGGEGGERRSESGVGLGHRQARTQASHQREILPAADGAAYLADGRPYVDPVAPRIPEARGHDADDRIWSAVDLNGLADDARHTTERALPDLVRDDRDIRPGELVFITREGPPQRRSDAQNLEVVRRDSDHLEVPGCAAGEEVDALSRADREGLEFRSIVPEELEFRVRDGAFAVGAPISQNRQPLLVRKR